MLQGKHKHIIQPKLSIGQPNDRFEQEADHVADQVLQMDRSQTPTIQRKCAACEEEELQMKPIQKIATPIVQKQEKMLQMKGFSNENQTSTSLESSLQQSKRNGQNLDASTQSSMSKSIGADFSNVKIHTDSNAVQMNQQLNAKAFTNGSDVYFNQGQYNPNSLDGKHLLAHELTHVVQQGGKSQTTSGVSQIAKSCKNDRKGSLWYSSKPKALIRKRKLERTGSCEGYTYKVKRFNHPTKKGKYAYRVEICNIEACDSTPKKDSKTTKKRPRKTKKLVCPQGKAKKVKRDVIGHTKPINTKNYITSLNVSLGARKVTAKWLSGIVNKWECSPNPSKTPKGKDKVGVKCGINHTSYKKYHMAYFTGFKSKGFVYGFHNSQPVGKRYNSAGCVRVRCKIAKTINENTWSNKTKIIVK